MPRRWAAAYLTRHPQLLDELLDSEALASAPDWPAFRARVAERLQVAHGQVEMQMDILRREHHAETFRILLQDLHGLLTVEQVADRLSDLADAMLEVTLGAVWAQLATRHAETPRFAVIAYGGWAGRSWAMRPTSTSSSCMTMTTSARRTSTRPTRAA